MTKVIRNMPSHSIIFNCWKDMCITPDGNIVHEKDKSKDDKYILIDYYEPCCWCCGKLPEFTKKQEELYKKLLHSDHPERIWDMPNIKSLLNRCHIIPKALGGPDSENNLFLLCEECHRKSPDTIIPKYFFKYIYEHQGKGYWDKLFEESKQFAKYMKELCSTYNKNYNYVDDNFDIQNFFEYMKEKYVSHYGKVSMYTMASILCDYLPEKIKTGNESLDNIIRFC